MAGAAASPERRNPRSMPPWAASRQITFPWKAGLGTIAAAASPPEPPLAAGMTSWAVGNGDDPGSVRISRTIRAKAVSEATRISNTPAHLSATISPYRRCGLRVYGGTAAFVGRSGTRGVGYAAAAAAFAARALGGMGGGILRGGVRRDGAGCGGSRRGGRVWGGSSQGSSSSNQSSVISLSGRTGSLGTIPGRSVDYEY